jgi:drug/metabolite transporter (DMT)-like permease
VDAGRGHPVLRRTRHGRQLLGAALGLVGVAVVLGRGSLETLRQVHFVPGDLYVLLAVIGWAFYSWLLARPPAHMQGTQRPAHWDWAGFLLVQTCSACWLQGSSPGPSRPWAPPPSAGARA